jgi:hypothetical protein
MTDVDPVDLETLLSWRGRPVKGADGETLGKLGALYLDGASERPAFAGLHTGLFGRNESIVPLAELYERDGELVLPFDEATVKGSPNIDPDAVLTAEEEDALHQYYGTSPGTSRPVPSVEGEMIRSEEEVQTRTGSMAPTERVRLRKVLVTENVEQTVPVRREVVQLETEPVPEGTIESVQDVDEVPETDLRDAAAESPPRDGR